jgi:hypothetical protein
MGSLAATKRVGPPPRPMLRSTKPAAAGSLPSGMAINTLAGLPTLREPGRENELLSIHDDAGVFVLSLTAVIKSSEILSSHLRIIGGRFGGGCVKLDSTNYRR